MTKPRKLKSPNGFDVFVGRNAQQNEYVTFSLSLNNDLWFHAANCPGSHVVLKADDMKSWGDQDIYFAAQMAVLYSKNKNPLKCSVHYCYVRDVTKPRNTDLGTVSIQNEFNIVVGL